TEAALHLAQERLGVAGLRVLQPVPAEDEHGELGQVVAGQDVEGAAVEHLLPGVEAVAVEAGGVADAQAVAPGSLSEWDRASVLSHSAGPVRDPAPAARRTPERCSATPAPG